MQTSSELSKQSTRMCGSLAASSSRKQLYLYFGEGVSGSIDWITADFECLYDQMMVRSLESTMIIRPPTVPMKSVLGEVMVFWPLRFQARVVGRPACNPKLSSEVTDPVIRSKKTRRASEVR